VVRGQSHLMLAATYDDRGACHVGATRLIVDAIVLVGRGCGLLMALLAPLLASLGALLDILYDDARRNFPIAASGRVKLGRLSADGVLDDDAMQLLGDILGGVG
jgi:hypothetical protein